MDNRDANEVEGKEAAAGGPTAADVIGGLERELSEANNRALQYSITLTALLTKLEELTPAAGPELMPDEEVG